MSALIEAAKQHYSDLLDGELKYIDVPEWQVDGKPARIYYRQHMTVEQKGVLVALFNKGEHYEMMVTAIIFAAKNEDGTKQFQKNHKYELMKMVSAEVIESIFTRMELFSLEDNGEAKKQ